MTDQINRLNYFNRWMKLVGLLISRTVLKYSYQIDLVNRNLNLFLSKEKTTNCLQLSSVGGTFKTS